MVAAQVAIATVFASTLVCAYTTRSYDLEVPGSSPIRIIEADPGWHLNGGRMPLPPAGTPDLPHELRPDFEHRNDKTDADDDDGSADKLKKFLHQFAQQHKVDGEPIEDQLVLKDRFEEGAKDKPETGKSWNLLHFDRLQHSPEPDSPKWVSMDALPWSVSKISKWHGRPKNDKYSSLGRPNNDRFHQQIEYPRPTYSKRPVIGYLDDIQNDDIDEPYQPPTATFGQKVKVETVQHKQKQDCNQVHDAEGDIITDGLAANFPDHEYGNNRRRGVASDPGTSHPFDGDGEWILLSTTKGYKYPKQRQRAIQFTDAPGANSMQAHKAVKLTVLPPLNDGRINMTTSHGGLLQVDGTLQSVDEAQRQYAKRQKSKRTPTHRPVKKARPRATKRARRGQTQGHGRPLRYELQGAADLSAEGSNDSNAVMAAVGAGMIPAGMALLVPMAMHGKRRRRRAADPHVSLPRPPI